MGSTNSNLTTPTVVANNTTLATQQNKSDKLTGKVVDANGEPIIGATVTQNGTDNVTVTDIDGNFTLNSKSPSATVTITYVGFDAKQVKLTAGRAKRSSTY